MMRRLVIALVILGALGLAGCGGGGDAAGTAAAPGSTDSGSSGTPTDTGGATGTPISDPGAMGDPSATAMGGATALPELNGYNVGGMGSSSSGSFNLNDETASPITDDPAANCDFGIDCSTETTTGTTTTETATTTTTESTVGVSLSYNRAKIVLNGQVYTVKKGGVFPSDTQIFKVTGIDSKGVTLELVAGEFTNGSNGVHLTVGERIKLLNQDEGEDYILKLTKTYGTSDSG